MECREKAIQCAWQEREQLKKESAIAKEKAQLRQERRYSQSMLLVHSTLWDHILSIIAR
jgi:hypothetical protein